MDKLIQGSASESELVYARKDILKQLHQRLTKSFGVQGLRQQLANFYQVSVQDIQPQQLEEILLATIELEHRIITQLDLFLQADKFQYFQTVDERYKYYWQRVQFIAGAMFHQMLAYVEQHGEWSRSHIMSCMEAAKLIPISVDTTDLLTMEHYCVNFYPRSYSERFFSTNKNLFFFN